MQDTNDSPVVWENPPAEGAPRRKLGANHPLIVEMKANPGRWARFAEYPRYQTAMYVVKRVQSGDSAWSRPARSFEATVRRMDGKAVVYARYVGQPNGDAR